MAQYGKPEYWEERYQKDPEPFDWYQRYANLRELFAQYLRKGSNLLITGCGNSRLTEDMYEDGYLSIANTDISRTVIDAMASRHKGKAGVTWQVMNICAMSYPDASFDGVVDKGTLDSLLCGDNSTANASRYCAETARVLKPGGVFLIVSYGIPENRLSYLENDEYGWRVLVHTLPKPSVSASGAPDGNDPSQVHYVYICTKR